MGPRLLPRPIFKHLGSPLLAAASRISLTVASGSVIYGSSATHNIVGFMSPSVSVGDAAAASTLIRDRLIKLSQVMDMVGLGKTRVYELIKSGDFPAPCKPGGTASRWSENAVLNWVADCKAQTVH